MALQKLYELKLIEKRQLSRYEIIKKNCAEVAVKVQERDDSRMDIMSQVSEKFQERLEK